MNLCLHEETREKCRSSARKVVEVLTNLMDTKHKFVMPYVNGALYSLLTDVNINREAKKINIENILKTQIKVE